MTHNLILIYKLPAHLTIGNKRTLGAYIHFTDGDSVNLLSGNDSGLQYLIKYRN